MLKDLRYEIVIEGSSEAVWRTIVEPQNYAEWVKAFSPKSQYRGEWKKGEEMYFFDPDMGGTMAVLEEVEPFGSIVMIHTATVTREGVRETTGDMTEKWVGTREAYRLSEAGGRTTLTIELRTDEIFQDMFDSAWPSAIENIKEMVESV